MFDLKKIQEEIREFWKREKINEKIMQRDGDPFFLLDGPPYANDIPHVGHIKNTVFKDVILRAASMEGKKILFQAGFDTHGLPIENKVEKKLGLTSKKDIESFGIEKFMHECKDNAAIHKEIWMKVYDRLGSLYALKEPYMTYENYYIQSGWWTFGEMHNKGLISYGEKPVMWCPHCQTSLAGYEVTDSYKDVSDPGIYVLFKLRDEDASLLVYTTTPWTLPANVAVAVAPNEQYVLIKSGGRKIILGEKRLQIISEMEKGYSVIKTFLGKELIGKKYEPLLDVPIQRELTKGTYGKAHEVIASIPLLKERVASKIKSKKNMKGEDLFEEFVTMQEGTGLVHTAPGHGKTDYLVGQHYQLACVSPVDDQCQLTADSGFSGFVKKADKEILKVLNEQGKLFYDKMITHSYPLCWRCKSPLIFRLSKQLFLNIEKIKKIMQRESEKVDWLPSFAGERFAHWIANADDWNISRQRYWGIPIPLWQCECGKEKIITDANELGKISGKPIDDLHTIDNLQIQCESCKKTMKKFKGILDVWFDSGIAPWASMGYPYKNKEIFEKHFPINRINEAQDQIRGWFYALMACSVATFGKAPYDSVSMVGWVVDKKGDKMSKSVGNVVTGEDAINELGADVLRYYFCWDSAPYEIQKFNIENAKKEIGSFFTILCNLQNLASAGKIEKLSLEDKWIISKLHHMTKNFKDYIKKYEFHSAARALTDFVMKDLSRGYIQMTRDKEASQSIIVGICLEHILRLLAPLAPFISEYLWQDLVKKKIAKEESVHLTLWPGADSKKIDNELEESFDHLIEIIEWGMRERDRIKIGLRWPLGKIQIVSTLKFDKDFQEIIQRQLNVKEILWTVDSKQKTPFSAELDSVLTAELEAEGYAREFIRKVQTERKQAGFVKGQLVNLTVVCDRELQKMLNKHLKIILNKSNLKELIFSDDKLLKNIIDFSIKNYAGSFSFY